MRPEDFTRCPRAYAHPRDYHARNRNLEPVSCSASLDGGATQGFGHRAARVRSAPGLLLVRTAKIEMLRVRACIECHRAMTPGSNPTLGMQ